MSIARHRHTSARGGALGPCFLRPREDRHAPFVRLCSPLNCKLWRTWGEKVIACDFLISSGMLIPMAALNGIAPMDAGLFIDNIDLEWSFRARARGYRLYGVWRMCRDDVSRSWRRPSHAAVRFGAGSGARYMMRNRIRLCRLPHTPRVWIAQDLPRVLVKLLLFGVLIGPRRRNLRCMFRGLLDGLRGHQGEGPVRVRKTARSG